MPLTWAEPDTAFAVLISTAGPLDPPGSGQSFNLSDHAGVDYLDGEAGISIRRGRSDEFGHFQAGSCSFTLRNNNREFDPNNSSSPFADILKPRRHVLIVTGHPSDPTSLTVLFAGYIDAWPQTWTKTTGSVEIVAHDLLSVLAQSTTSPASGVLIFDDPIFGIWDRFRFTGDLPQEFTGERIESLIQMSGLSAQSVSLQQGLTQVVGLEPSGDVLGLCQEAETAEAGFLFVDRAGTLRFYDRHSRFQNPRLSTVQATFTDDQYSGMAVEYGLAQMWNDVRFTRPAASEGDMPIEQIVVDEATIAEFGRRAHSASIPVISDGETLARAEFWRDRYSAPQQRPSPVQIKPRRDMDGLFMKVARRELLDRVELVRTPLGVGDPIVFTGLIEQLEHRITKTDWTCTIGISPIDADEGEDFLIFDQGNWDEHTFAY